ncbi:Urease accessory protein UreD [Penicillium bovifimosum]|uniref:Urease accessory protein UreD n=1 Tax=Penicillium bovifimosum TaxID=126998 RepID=A0A9W9GJJ6_9EURO|nr:Urease accessory protein UreD [Penicillium bovifimosum]KAJ5121607.1 Urease accessory protein UreD [Penicillium bovifimosum]
MRKPTAPIPSPFQSSIAKQGQGKVVLSLLPPNNPTFTTLTYKYPLKLVPRNGNFIPTADPSDPSDTSPPRPVHLYLLTYGGGLLPGDHISVSITLEARTRMVVTTPQGSTKIFKTDPTNPDLTSPTVIKGHRDRMPTNLHQPDMSQQTLDVHIGPQAALCYLPDPSVPYRNSRYAQHQSFTIDASAKGPHRASLCVLDWVTQGRTSRGENWDFRFWRGRNEVWARDATGRSRLLLRDSVVLDDESERDLDSDDDSDSYEELDNAARNLHNGLVNRADRPSQTKAGLTPLNLIAERCAPHGVVGTLILSGPVFEALGAFLLQKFQSQPRIGSRNWSDQAPSSAPEPSVSCRGDVTWTAARVRAGFVLVKFGAKDFETAKDWLGGLIREEGSVVREFGEEALFCL